MLKIPVLGVLSHIISSLCSLGKENRESERSMNMLLQIFPWSYNCLVIFSVQKFGKMVSFNKKKETHVVSWWNLYCGQVVLLALLSSLVNNSQLGSDMK